MSEKLKRSVGLPTAIAASVGIVIASTTLVDMGHGFGLAGIGFLIPMFIAMLLNLCVALSLGTFFVNSSCWAMNHYTLPTFGSFIAIFSVIVGYVIPQVFAGSAESTIPGLVLQQLFFPQIDPRFFL